MKKSLILLISIFTLGSSSGYSQYAISYGAGVDALTERLGAEGMTVIHSELYCDHHNYGTYQGLGELGIDTGIVLSNVPVHANRLFGDFTVGVYPALYLSDADPSHMPDEDLRNLVNGWNGGA